MKPCRAAVHAGRQPLRRRSTRPPGRRYSQVVRSCESVIVPCHSNGEISLDIHHPSAASAHLEATPRIIVYLPRGPLWGNEEQEVTTTSSLADDLPNHHIVRINYRLSQQHQYPTPIHDTLTGWDWILQNVLPKRAISRPGRADHVGRLAVCGELIGAGLASMLALTECRTSEPGVVAAAVSNPLLDWPSLDQMAQPTARDSKGSDAAGDKLLDLRTSLFPKPDRYFDPFASPLLLFRTAGVQVPPAPAEVDLDDMAQLSLHEREEHVKQYASSNLDNEAQTNELLGVPASPTTARKTSRRYPSPSLNLRLPAFRISSGSFAPFSQQSEELAHVLRQSFIRQARQTATGSTFGRKILLDDEEDEFADDDEKLLKVKQKLEAEDKAPLHRHRDLGLWDGSKEGMERVRQVAIWLKERTV